MTSRDTHDINEYDLERESAAEGLADALFGTQGSYASALLRLCRTLVDMKGATFVRNVTQEIDEEKRATEDGDAIGTDARVVHTTIRQGEIHRETSPIPRHTRFATADESYKMFDVTGRPRKILGDSGFVAVNDLPKGES